MTAALPVFKEIRSADGPMVPEGEPDLKMFTFNFWHLNLR
jgi:hypothetical protein